MKNQQQWCDNKFCEDFEKINGQNIKIHSNVERRYYCTTCKRTFSFDKGNFFETLRTKRVVLLDAVALLVERNSLRAISRIKHSAPNTVLHGSVQPCDHGKANSLIINILFWMEAGAQDPRRGNQRRTALLSSRVA